MISWVDLTPTILDFAGAYDAKTQAVKPEISGSKSKPYRFHGRSFLSITEQTDPKGWDEIYASHTFHEITMYYPMRVVRTRKYKLIWNIAHPLPYPFASDLWAAPTFQDVYKREGLKGMYGKRTIGAYIHRPKYELFDLESDPDETKNLANDDQFADVLKELQGKLRAFQKRTQDPWILKWNYE